MYQPLFLKYRPQTFTQVVGQDHVVAPLSNALRTGRLAHAYLFTGSRGTGKTSSARIFAKAINCLHGPTPEPCGVCPLCQNITNGSALDVIEIDAASNTGVDNIRELIERAQLAPAQAKYKVYVIDECHMLSGAAFNSLLKTLEEPPPKVIFILATTDPQRVLPTIISRCQRFDFKRIALAAMTEHLGMIAKAEQIVITAEALELVAQIAQGGLRDAQSLLDQLGLLEGTIYPEQVWDLVGSVPEQDLMTLLAAIEHQDPAQIITQTRHLVDRGREPLQVLQDLVGFLRDVLLAKIAPHERDWVALTRPTWDRLVAWGPSLDQQWLLQLQNTLRSAEPLVKNSTQPRLWLEVTLLDLTRVAESKPPIPASLPVQPIAIPAVLAVPPVLQAIAAPLPEVLSPAIPPLEVPLLEKTTLETVPSDAVPARHLKPVPNPPKTTATGLAGRWQDFLETVRHPPTKGMLREAFLIKETDQKLVIGFKDKFFLNMLRDPKVGPKKREDIQQAVERFIGRRLSLEFEIAAQGPQLEVVASPPAPPPMAPPPGRPDRPKPEALPPPAPRGPEALELDSAARSVANFFNGVIITDQPIAAGLPLEEEEEF